MKDAQIAELSVIGMKGCEAFAEQVDNYLKEWRRHTSEDTYLVEAICPRFGTGEGKGLIHQSMRGQDVYIICDVFNYGVTYRMYGQTVPMSPDDHYADLKRIIAAIAGKARRITVIMPMLYEGRQHKRSTRESLDCALMLQELVGMGVTNIITFDAHDPRIQNAIKIGFESVSPTYQMIKAIAKSLNNDIKFTPEKTMMISPDEGGMGRCVYYSQVLGVQLGMFYKRRDFSKIVDGRNPIVSHEFLGSDVEGKDVIVVDDMISSGDSMLDVCRQLKKLKAKRIFVFSSFGLFSSGLERFDEAFKEGVFDKIFTTNLIYQTPELLTKEWYYSVDMSKYVALIIDTLNHDRSVSPFLNPIQKINSYIDQYNLK